MWPAEGRTRGRASALFSVRRAWRDDLEVRVLWEPWLRVSLAERQLRRREASWEGSCRQSFGPRNTKRIRGGRSTDERAEKRKVRSNPDRTVVDATGTR